MRTSLKKLIDHLTADLNTVDITFSWVQNLNSVSSDMYIILKDEGNAHLFIFQSLGANIGLRVDPLSRHRIVVSSVALGFRLSSR